MAHDTFIPSILEANWQVALSSVQPGLHSETVSKERTISPVSDLAHFIADSKQILMGAGYAICVI